MIQRISVRAIITRGSDILMLRRANGRESIMGLYELPGGKLNYGEQPEDALRRYIQDDIGHQVDRADLFDVVTYIDHDDRNIQYAVITYKAVLIEGKLEPKLSDNYSDHVWQELEKIQQDSITDLTQLILGILQQEALTDKKLDKNQNYDDINTTYSEAIIYADGGSRGNPGPSACGYVIMDNTQRILAQGGEYLGITTNNQAEYHGVRLGLEKALELNLRSVDFRLDSMLVVNQMNGIYAIKNRELWPINERIRGLMSNFANVSFHHVPRDMNQLADAEVNKSLDSHTEKFSS